MDMIYSWTARRSGGRITIRGVDDTGADIRIANIDAIELDRRGIIAIDKNRERFLLAESIALAPEAA